MKPIIIDRFTEKCGKCGELVKKTFLLSSQDLGSNAYDETWYIVINKKCDSCGEPVEREKIEQPKYSWENEEQI